MVKELNLKTIIQVSQLKIITIIKQINLSTISIIFTIKDTKKEIVTAQNLMLDLIINKIILTEIGTNTIKMI